MTIAKLPSSRCSTLAILGVLVLIVLYDPTMRTGKRGVMLLSGADAVSIDRAARDFRMPDQIE